MRKIKTLVFSLVLVVLSFSFCYGWQRDAGFKERGDLTIGNDKIVGNPTTGIYFDTDADGDTEITMNPDGTIDSSGMIISSGTLSVEYLTVTGTSSFTGAISASTITAKDAAGLYLLDDGLNQGVFIEDGGNVGIGTTDPNEKLEVVGNFSTIKNSTPIISMINTNATDLARNRASIIKAIGTTSLSSTHTISNIEFSNVGATKAGQIKVFLNDGSEDDILATDFITLTNGQIDILSGITPTIIFRNPLYAGLFGTAYCFAGSGGGANAGFSISSESGDASNPALVLEGDINDSATLNQKAPVTISGQKQNSTVPDGELLVSFNNDFSARKVDIYGNGDIVTIGSVSASSGTFSRTNGYGIEVSSGALFAIEGGNVGISTGTPQEKLDVIGNIRAEYGVGASTGVFSSTLSALTLNTGQGDYELYAMNQDVETTDAVTFAPLFRVTGAGATHAYFDSGVTGEPQLQLYPSGGVYVIDALRNGLDNLAHLILKPGLYNVGIGTMTPTEKLEVNGNIKTNYGIIAATGTFSDNVGIGTTSPETELTVNGIVSYSINSSTQIVYSTDTISITANYTIIESTGGAVTMSSSVQISTTASVNFALPITLMGADDTNTIKLVDGNGLQLQNGNSFTMGYGDMWKGVFDPINMIYHETARSDN